MRIFMILFGEFANAFSQAGSRQPESASDAPGGGYSQVDNSSRGKEAATEPQNHDIGTISHRLKSLVAAPDPIGILLIAASTVMRVASRQSYFYSQPTVRTETHQKG
jgi:hypothetical protein